MPRALPCSSSWRPTSAGIASSGHTSKKYFRALPKIWDIRDGLLRLLLGQALFPYTAASPELLERVDEFLGQPHLNPALARVVAEGRDVAEKALRSRELPGQQR